MKHHFFICAIALITAAAHGQQTSRKLHGWQFIGKFEGGTVQYIDMDALKKERGYVRTRTLVNHKTPEWSATSERILSSIDVQYVDCKQKRFALLASAEYECQMARCVPKENYSIPFNESAFSPITNDSSQAGNLYDLVCQ